MQHKVAEEKSEGETGFGASVLSAFPWLIGAGWDRS